MAGVGVSIAAVCGVFVEQGEHEDKDDPAATRHASASCLLLPILLNSDVFIILDLIRNQGP